MRRREFATAVAAAAPDGGIAPVAGRLKQGAMRANFAPEMPFEHVYRTVANLG